MPLRWLNSSTASGHDQPRPPPLQSPRWIRSVSAMTVGYMIHVGMFGTWKMYISRIRWSRPQLNNTDMGIYSLVCMQARRFSLDNTKYSWMCNDASHGSLSSYGPRRISAVDPKWSPLAEDQENTHSRRLAIFSADISLFGTNVAKLFSCT